MNDFDFESEEPIRRTYSNRRSEIVRPQPVGMPQLLGVFGSVLLAIGTFLPAINIPVLGSFTFLQVSHKIQPEELGQVRETATGAERLKSAIRSGLPIEGGLILVMALCSFVLVLIRQEVFLFGSFVVCVLCLLAAYFRIDNALSNMLDNAIKDKSIIGIAFSASISYGVSWIVLCIGCIMLICSPILTHGRR